MLRRFRRRRRVSAALLDAPRAGIERAMGALPSNHVADLVVDLASRTGVDLGEVADRLLERIGDLASRAGDEAMGLADTDTARQLRGAAARAAGNATEFVYRSGGERLLDVLPRRRSRTRRRVVLFGVLAGLTAAGAAGYVVASRRAEQRRQDAAAQLSDTDSVSAGSTSLSEIPRAAAEKVTAPVSGLLGNLRRRWQVARGEAKTAQVETERELWREYGRDVYHIDDAAPGTALPYGSGEQR
jgi:hypothetical protein